VAKLLSLAAAVVLLATGALARAALPYMDADSEAQALVMGAGEIARTEQFRKSCSEELPALKSSFGKAALLWRIANKTEIQAVESYKARTSDRALFDKTVSATETASRAALAVMTADLRKRACYGFLALAKEQNQRMADRTPKVSTFLASYLKKNPLSDVAAEQYDYLMGCAKAAANKNIDYDKAQAACTCQWVAFQAALGKDERAKFYAMTNDPAALMEWPPGRKAVESAQTCARRYLN